MYCSGWDSAVTELETKEQKHWLIYWKKVGARFRASGSEETVSTTTALVLFFVHSKVTGRSVPYDHPSSPRYVREYLGTRKP